MIQILKIIEELSFILTSNANFPLCWMTIPWVEILQFMTFGIDKQQYLIIKHNSDY